MNKTSIECTWSPSRRDFNRFIRNIEKGNVKIIDYFLIKNKLIKSDPRAEEPCDSIIGLAIVNEITRILCNDNTNNRVIYLFRNIDYEVVSNFKNLIYANTDNFEFSLTIINSNIFIEKRVVDLFDYINKTT
jgi:hypothetical protein